MIIGTTPTLTLRLKSTDVDLNEAKDIYFTIRQGSIKYTKTKTNSEITIVDNNTVRVRLTQQETLTFRQNLEAEIQLNWTYSTGARAATKVKKIDLNKNLLKEVL